MKQVTEYVLSAVDKHGDIQENYYYKTKREALENIDDVDTMDGACEITFEKWVSKFEDDGDLVDRQYIELELPE